MPSMKVDGILGGFDSLVYENVGSVRKDIALRVRPV